MSNLNFFIHKYPDGSTYAKIDSEYEFYFKKHLGKMSGFFMIKDYRDLWALGQLVDAANNLDLKPEITIPWLIDAQADRRFNFNESNNLKLVCNFLNNLDAKFSIFHPHNPAVVEALIDGVKIIDNSRFIEVVLKDLNNPEIVLMSTDAGGYKPLMKLADDINFKGEVLSASKARLGVGNIVQSLPVNDLYARDILIVDDICVNGGTFIGLAKRLNEANCGNLYLAVSHMTVSTLSQELLNSFQGIYTTDSLDLSYRVIENDVAIFPSKLKVINRAYHE